MVLKTLRALSRYVRHFNGRLSQRRYLGMDLPMKSMAAAAVGAGIGVLAFVVHHIQARNEKEELYKQLGELQKDVTLLKQEIYDLRSQNKDTADKPNGAVSHNERRARIRRRVRQELQNLSGYDTESTMYSAVDTDDDDMFYDLSSEDEGDSTNKLNTSSSEMIDFSEIDKLFEGSIEEKSSSLCLALKHLDARPADPNVLWRVGRAYKYQVDVAAAVDDKAKQLEFIEEGLKYAQKAVELSPNLGDAQMWFAILLGLRSDFLPLTERVQNGNKFHKHLYLAIEMLPENRILFHMMAKFKFAIANLSWIERRAAKMIAEVPECTMREAIDDALKAEKLSEPWAENKILLAKSYLAEGDYATGLSWLDQARELSEKTQNIVTLKEADELLQKYKKHRK